MKLKRFDIDNCGKPALNTKQKTITFSRTGDLRISSSAADEMDLMAGNSIAVFQDEENPTDWYVSKDEKGFKLKKPKSKGNVGLVAHNKKLYAHFIKANSFDETQSYRMLIAKQPTFIEGDDKEYWGILLTSFTKFNLAQR